MKRSSRIPHLSVVLLVLTVLLALQAGHSALVAGDHGPEVIQTPTATPEPEADVLPNDVPAGSTLISVQSYGGFTENNGRVLVVTPHGETVWEWAPPNSRVFDAEYLENGNVQVALGERVQVEDCPVQYQGHGHCILNRVVEVDFETKDVVWEYSWYDEFINWHEVHEADRLDNGEVAIVDMGKNRAFTVDPAGEITWEWQFEEHLGEGSPFHDEYGGPIQQSPTDDWTHANDISWVEDQYFQLSIRNFDVVIWVDPETDEIVKVIGEPGNHEIMHNQHNPQWLPERGTLLVADSENDRAVELRPDGEIIWEYGGSGQLSWPRDADRLPNGNTLITDTYHNRVIEVTPDGEIVWEYRVTIVEDGQLKGGLVYIADRLSMDGQRLAEEQSTFEDVDYTETGTVTPHPDRLTTDGGELDRWIPRLEAWSRFYFPYWFEFRHLLTMTAGVFVGLWLVGELAWLGWRTRKE